MLFRMRCRSRRPRRWRNAASSSATSAAASVFNVVLPRWRRAARWRRGGVATRDAVDAAPRRMDRAGRVTGRPTQCTKYLDALEDLDLLSAKEMRVVFEKSERDLVPLDEHVERLTASRNLLAARLREVEDEDVEGHCWPGAC